MKRFLPAAIAFVILATGLWLRVSDPAWLENSRDRIFDLYQRGHPRVTEKVPIRIIDIDDESLDRLGQWPWSRTVMASLLNELAGAGAAAVAFDMVFAEPDRTSPKAIAEQLPLSGTVRDALDQLPDNDETFARALAQARAVLGFALSDEAPKARMPAAKAGFATAGPAPAPFLIAFDKSIPALELFEAAAQGNGALNFSPEEDGVVRRIPLLLRLGETPVPSLAAEALRVAQGASAYIVKSVGASGETAFGEGTGLTDVKIGAFAVPTNANGRLWYYAAPPGNILRVPAWRVLAGKENMNDFAGHIVLIGTSAIGLHDLRFTPLGTSVPGVVIQAQTIEQIITGRFLVRPEWADGAEIMLTLVLGILLILLIHNFGALPSAAIGFAAIGSAIILSIHAFKNSGVLLDPIFPCTVALSIYISLSLVRHIQAERRQRWIKDAFSSYVSPNLVAELAENLDSLVLGGERRDLTFIFTDLAGFTPLVEQSKPGALIPLLNEYLNEMIRIGFKYGGTLDAIVGDATTFFFNAPVHQEDHADRALACALEMDEFATRFSAEKTKVGLPLGATRIGVHSGPVIIGNMGGDVIFNYAAHGDAINVAARLESVNKHLGTKICISIETASRCKNFSGRPVGAIQLKGKAEGIIAFEPLKPEEMETARITAYLSAYDLMTLGDENAISAFEDLAELYPDDPLVSFHLRHLQKGEIGTLVKMSEK